MSLCHVFWRTKTNSNMSYILWTNQTKSSFAPSHQRPSPKATSLGQSNRTQDWTAWWTAQAHGSSTKFQTAGAFGREARAREFFFISLRGLYGVLFFSFSLVCACVYVFCCFFRFFVCLFLPSGDVALPVGAFILTFYLPFELFFLGVFFVLLRRAFAFRLSASPRRSIQRGFLSERWNAPRQTKRIAKQLARFEGLPKGFRFFWCSFWYFVFIFVFFCWLVLAYLLSTTIPKSLPITAHPCNKPIFVNKHGNNTFANNIKQP